MLCLKLGNKPMCVVICKNKTKLEYKNVKNKNKNKKKCFLVQRFWAYGYCPLTLTSAVCSYQLMDKDGSLSRCSAFEKNYT